MAIPCVGQEPAVLINRRIRPEASGSAVEAIEMNDHPMTGRTLSRYKILERIGAGGMGEVFIAEDCKLRRNVAPA